jgi:uncharacterized protein
MISLLVSSKTMVSNWPAFEVEAPQPRFLKEAEVLNSELKKLSEKDLQTIMYISPALSSQVKKWIADWSPLDGTPAWYTFVGDVYKGLKAKEFTKADIDFAQKHCGTISGLYGVVRPLDLINPYRLELMYKLTGESFKNLYDFWGNKIAKTIPKDEPVINLSSEEFIKTLRPYLKKDQIITPHFLQTKNGKPDFQVIHAKIARGTMCNWIVKNRINDPAKLVNFSEKGYLYQPKLSTALKPVFQRA